MRRAFCCVVFAVTVLLGGATRSETVTVKYVGEIDLAPFACQSINTSSFIERICYDAKPGHMLIRMKPATWYQYCAVPSSVVNEFYAAESKGNYYNKAIKGRYGCPPGRPPANTGSEDRP